MKFAENNKISHRQLYRQMVLAFMAPFLLCLFPKGSSLGVSGIAGTAAAMTVLLFYVIFLIRVSPYYLNLKKYMGAAGSRLAGIFYVIYTLFTGAYLLALLERIVPASVVTGVPGPWISFLAVLVCGVGIHRGMQKRGRMAEVSGGMLLFAVALMMLLSVGQARLSYLGEMAERSAFTGKAFGENMYRILCAFSGIGLLPFVLSEVDRKRNSVKAGALGVLTLSGVLLGMELLLPAVFGWDRLLTEEYPILPLLAGANLPGNVLARFDVLWMAFLIYSLLFSVGSLLHYGNQILKNVGMGTGRWWMAVVMYGLSLLEVGGMGVETYYESYLAFVFVPGMALLQVFLMIRGRSRGRKKRAAAATAVLSSVLVLCLGLGGCAGVEPEKRLYPLALGADISRDDGYELTYGMADLPQATGQGKPEDGDSKNILEIAGKDFAEIEAAYGRSQEKYLDMGHLKVLILGEQLTENERWKELLSYVEQEPFIGEDVYVFRTAVAADVVKWKNARGSSVGDYLLEMLENKNSANQTRTVTLREVYYQWKKDGTLPQLPEIVLKGESLQVFGINQ